jgi:hypothetical protein
LLDSEAKNIDSYAESEAKLVQYAMELCEYLEKSKSPGKSILLLNMKKLGEVVSDPQVAKAFHSQIRGVAKRQEICRGKAARQTSFHVRFQQAKRKHWVDAKARTFSKSGF